MTGRSGSATDRLDVRKTYKLYIGGAFPRSESGRVLPGRRRRRARCWPTPRRPRARTCATRCRPPARRSPAGPGATAYNRGQVLYRVAEMLEGRREQFVAEVAAAEGVAGAAAAAAGRRRDRPLGLVRRLGRQVRPGGRRDQPGRRAVLQLLAARADRRGRRPRAAGVVACSAWSSVLAPVIATGNTVVVLASQDRPLPAVTLAEVLATSDLPGGVVNLLTGSTAELAPWLAGHRDVNALDLTGVGAADRVDAAAQAAADNVKRVYVPRATPDWAARARHVAGSARSSRPRRSGTRSASEADRPAVATGGANASSTSALAARNATARSCSDSQHVPVVADLA